MSVIAGNVNLTLVSNATITNYRERVIASGVALLAAYFVDDGCNIDKLLVPVPGHLLPNREQDSGYAEIDGDFAGDVLVRRGKYQLLLS